MLARDLVEKQLAHTFESIDFPSGVLGEKISGKVRDCYVHDGKRILIASDRLSAFDVILTTIPFKGQMLTQLAAYWFAQTESIVPNHIIDYPHPNVMVGREVDIVPVEVIVRGYLAGSAWRDYQAGKAISGIRLPEGMKKSQKLEQAIITPSTKAEHGEHDMPISSEDIVAQGLVEKGRWEEICETALALFECGSRKAAEQGLILVDTKYEFGIGKDPDNQGKLILADEVHTQDSSRYWISSSYRDRFAAGDEPEMFDKEFVRGWLIEQGYMGEGTPPEFPDAFRVDVALRYMEAYEMITGQRFEAEVGPVAESIKKALRLESP